MFCYLVQDWRSQRLKVPYLWGCQRLKFDDCTVTTVSQLFSIRHYAYCITKVVCQLPVSEFLYLKSFYIIVLTSYYSKHRKKTIIILNELIFTCIKWKNITNTNCWLNLLKPLKLSGDNIRPSFVEIVL